MTLLDILIALPLCFLIFIGWKKGLVRTAATLAGVLAGLWASTHLSQQVAPLLGIEGENATLVAFIVTFVAALVLTYLLGRCIEGLMKAVKLGILNRLAGALLGAAEALCILAVTLNLIVLIDSNETLLKPTMKEKSLLYKPVYITGNLLTAELKNYITNHKEEWWKAVGPADKETQK